MAYIRCGGGGGTPTITQILNGNYALESLSSPPGSVYGKSDLDLNKQYIVVVSASTNCSTNKGFIQIDNGEKVYIPTHSSSRSKVNATDTAVITGVNSFLIKLGWDLASASNIWFKYNITIYEVA